LLGGGAVLQGGALKAASLAAGCACFACANVRRLQTMLMYLTALMDVHLCIRFSDCRFLPQMRELE